MWDAALWGLVQGLTEFLPISSSGHLVLVPEFLGVAGPDLQTAAVLHLGTLAAVVAYYRRDVVAVARFDAHGRRLAMLLLLGTIPAAVLGLAFAGSLDEAFSRPAWVGAALLFTASVLTVTRFLRAGSRRVEESRPGEALLVGTAQAIALFPGVSRSGMTIAMSLGLRFSPEEAARYSFLLGIPAIAGAGLLSLVDAGIGAMPAEVWIGVAVAAVSGYLAIAVLVRMITRIGIAPFAAYCIAAGIAGLIAG